MNELIERYPCLASCTDDIGAAEKMLIECYSAGGKLLVCGNGGSSADADHIVGELMKGFKKPRRLSDEKKAHMKKVCPEISDSTLSLLQMGLPAISLSSATALNTAFSNDESAELVFAQSVFALGKAGDVLIAISTSGNSHNVVEAVKCAKAIGMKTVGLTGIGGGELKKLCDVCITVPERETYKVQELHLPVYHYICARLEEYFF